jgi:hypothetical protein
VSVDIEQRIRAAATFDTSGYSLPDVLDGVLAELADLRRRDALARDVAERWDAIVRHGGSDENLEVCLDHLADEYATGGAR